MNERSYSIPIFLEEEAQEARRRIKQLNLPEEYVLFALSFSPLPGLNE